MSLALAPTIQAASQATPDPTEQKLLPPKDALEAEGIDKFAARVRDLVEGLWKQWRPEHFRFVANSLRKEGRQWLTQLNDNLVDYTMMNREAAKTLVVDNQIEDICNRTTARVVQRRMTLTTKPATTNEDDIHRSKVDNKLLGWVFDDQRMKLKIEALASYTVDLSCGYIAHSFDKDRTAVESEVIDPSQIMWPMWSRLDNEIGAEPIAPYAVRVKRMYRPHAERVYQRKFSSTQQILNDGRTYFKYLFDAEQRETVDNDIVLIVEMWVHPKYGPMDPAENPNGLIFTMDLNDQGPFSVKRWPYPYCGYVEGEDFTDDKSEQPHYPWHRAVYRKTMNTARSRGIIDMLYEDQMLLNRTQTQILWWQNIACCPILIRPEGSMRKDEAPIIRAGKIWDVNVRDGIQPPYYMQPPPLNNAIFAKPAELRQAMREKAAAIEMAGVAGDAPGVALAQRKAYDDQVHGPFMGRFMGTVGNSGKDVLKIIKCYFPATFTSEIFGRKTAESDAEVFNTQHIDTSLDIFAEADEYGYESKAMEDERIDNMQQKGQITPDEALAMKNHRDPQEAKMTDMDCAQWENSIMLLGHEVPSPPINAQNNDVHLEQVRQIIANKTFYKKDPRIQQVFLAHQALHEQRKMVLDQQQAVNFGAGMQQGQVQRGRAEPQINKSALQDAALRARKELQQPGVTDIQSSVNRAVNDATAKNQVAQERRA